MRALVFTILALLSSMIPGMAQDIRESPGVAALLKAYIDKHRSSEYVSGWRVQVVATTDRTAMENIRSRMQRDFPGVPVQVVHNRPYYHLRVGAFSDRKEAIMKKYFLRQNYPGAMEIADDRIIREQLLSGRF